MGKLNSRYTSVMKKAIEAIMPMITDITSDGFDDPSVKGYTDLTLESVALGGDFAQAMDDLLENQRLLKEQLKKIEEVVEIIDTKLDGFEAEIDTRIDGLEALITKPDKKKDN